MIPLSLLRARDSVSQTASPSVKMVRRSEPLPIRSPHSDQHRFQTETTSTPTNLSAETKAAYTSWSPMRKWQSFGSSQKKEFLRKMNRIHRQDNKDWKEAWEQGEADEEHQFNRQRRR